MNAKVIVIDGETYHSVDEMPPAIRQRYELAVRLLGGLEEENAPDTLESPNVRADRNRNGVPDLLENIVAANAILNGMKIVIDGREFNGIENLPPAARARYDAAMRKLDKNLNGIPDFVEGMLKHANQTTNLSTSYEGESTFHSSPADYAASATTSHAQPLPVSSAVEPEETSGWSLVLAGLFFILLCGVGAAGVWYFFLR